MFAPHAIAFLLLRPSTPQVHLIWSVDCPVAQRWLGDVRAVLRGSDLKQFDIRWWFPADSPSAMENYFREHRLSGTAQALKGQDLAQRFGLERFPSVVVLSPDGSTVYVGGLGSGRYPEDSSRKFLREALNAARDGTEMVPSRTESQGCLIPFEVRPNPSIPPMIATEAKRIVNQYCLPCHAEGGAAPIALVTQNQVRRWSNMMVDALQNRKMPPVTVEGRGKLIGLRTGLSTEEVLTMRRWQQAGAPWPDLPPQLPKGEWRTLPATASPSWGTWRWVDYALPTGEKPFAFSGVEWTFEGQGLARWAGLFATDRAQPALVVRGPKWVPPPSDWQLLDAVLPGTSHRPRNWKFPMLASHSKIVLRVLMFGNGEQRLKPRFRWIVSPVHAPALQLRAVRFPTGRFLPTEGAVRLGQAIQARERVSMTRFVPLFLPVPSEVTLDVDGSRFDRLITARRMMPPTFEFDLAGQDFRLGVTYGQLTRHDPLFRDPIELGPFQGVALGSLQGLRP